ncbi:MAG: Mur ligase family protein [Fibrobacterota bacterium]
MSDRGTALSLPDLIHSHYHYVGVAGSGMSALAQFQAMRGGNVTGSDRSLPPVWAAHFQQLGVRCFPQDGSGVTQGVHAVIRSTAVENDNADLARAAGLGVPIFHRSEVLAEWVNGLKTLAVAGTSGKSTVAAMAFCILDGAGLSSSIITGGNLVELQEKGLAGNAFSGSSDILVVEADESDGTIVEYRPHVGLIMNVEKDHKEISELLHLFGQFRAQSRHGVVNADAPLLAEFVKGSCTYSIIKDADFKAGNIRFEPRGSSFAVNNVPFTLPVPGLYNVENALAAIASCACYGVPLDAMVGPLAAFKGVARRFQLIGQKNGVEVIDDFAHNPAKVAAAIGAAQLRSTRVLAVFQPHGYGPLRFLKDDFVTAFRSALRPQDVLLMSEVYYAGGSVTRDVSSEDVIRPLFDAGRSAEFIAERKDIPARIRALARPGDCVLVMGARDATLTDFCREILEALG